MNLAEAGVVWTYPTKCGPLDDVRIVFKCDALHGQKVQFRVTDAAHVKYIDTRVDAADGEAELTIKAAGKSGVHFIQVNTDTAAQNDYMRCGSFRVEAKTGVATDTGEMDDLLDQLAEGLLQAIDITIINGREVTQYKTGDNTRQNLAYPAFAISALRYYIQDVKTMFEAIYEAQWPNGSLPDHVYGDGYPCPLTGPRLRSCMADLETGTVSTVCTGWQAHGDDQWLRGLMPRIEASLDYALTDPLIFDEEHGLIKRPHSFDEWDINFRPDGKPESLFTGPDSYFVLMQGDNSQLVAACGLLAEAYEVLGRPHRAAHWRLRQDHYREKANKIFWDGVKYKHHVHLVPFDHGDFDEDNQLTMSNAWAINRGFATHEQTVSIIDEYERRWKQTGDRFPWWSLQPGYPNDLNYFTVGGVWSKGEGEYCNGGLFPLVGGELCRAALRHGREELAYKLLGDVHEVIKRDNGAIFTWYHLDGEAAINAPHNQTNHDPWGISPWAQAIIEELAGIKTDGKLLEKVICAPRWPAVNVKTASATAHFPSSNTYFAYQYERSDERIAIHFTGTGKEVSFAVLLAGWTQCSAVTVDGKKAPFKTSTVEDSTYLHVDAEICGARELVIEQ